MKSKGINYCFTLGYNFTSEIELTTKNLYEMNNDFIHTIVDLGFPLVSHNENPISISDAKSINTAKIKEICKKYGSEYLKIENVGVSQNWTAVYKHLRLNDNDVMIGCDSDERPLNNGWVKAMGSVLRDDNVAMAVLQIDEHDQYVSSWAMEEKVISGVRCYEMHGNINWALMGLSGAFMNTVKEIPTPNLADKYGYLEYALYPLFAKHNLNWCVLSDYYVHHEFAIGLYREWKDHIVWGDNNPKQISFDDFLKSAL